MYILLNVHAVHFYEKERKCAKYFDREKTKHAFSSAILSLLWVINLKKRPLSSLFQSIKIKTCDGVALIGFQNIYLKKSNSCKYLTKKKEKNINLQKFCKV